MILGQGIDIVDVARIKQTFERFGDRFIKKVLSQEEISAIPKEDGKIIPFLAKHWAVKEATSKAVGCGFVNGAILHFKDVVLSKIEEKPFTGKPIIKKTDRLLAVIKKMYDLNSNDLDSIVFHVSTSGDGGFVIASVILEKK